MPTALITGANRGLGLEMARSLAAGGWELVVHARTEETGKPLAEALKARLWVHDFESHSFVKPELPPIDSLICNAGIYSDDPTRALESLRVNLRGPLLLCDALAPDMAPGSRIVLVSSGLGELVCFTPEEAGWITGAHTRDEIQQVAGRFVKQWQEGRTDPSPYNVSKALLNRYCQVLAREYPNLYINAVCPGWVRTDMGGRGAPRSIAEGAAGLLWAATQATQTGRFFRDQLPIAW